MGISYPRVKNKSDKIASTLRQQILQEVGNPKENKSLFENIGI